MIDLFGFLFKYFERPYVFLLVIPITFIWIYLLRKNFVKLYLGEEHEKKRKKLKIFIFISRAVIVLLLLVAFASPYIETTKVVKGDPKVTILVDNSTSIELFDFSFINSFRTELEKELNLLAQFLCQARDDRIPPMS